MTTTVDITLELDLARNMLGPLKPESRRRLQAVVNRPTQRTWEGAYSLIIGGDHWMTLWQAVCALDPSYNSIGKVTDQKGKVISGWKKIPPADLLVRAIRYATH